MSIWEIILPIAVGALIGYCTNYIAIKMLFLPRKELYIGKWKVPFTPGVIPKNKERLASAVGSAVSERLLTEQDIAASIQNSGIRDEIVRRITEVFAQDDSSVKDTLESVAPQESIEQMTDKAGDFLAEKILRAVKTMDMHSAIAEIAEKSFSGLFANPLVSMLLGGKGLNAMCDKIEAGISDYLNEKGQVMIADRVKQELESMLSKSLKSNLEQMDCNEEQIRTLIDNVIVGFMENHLSDITKRIKIRDIIEAKIKEMNVRELEDLVMSVMKTELQAIVNLGAVIGALTGVINIFI